MQGMSQTKCKYQREVGEFVRIIETQSSYNSKVTKIMQDACSYSYSFSDRANCCDTKSYSR